MSKFIIFCADGTWNGPDQDDNGDGQADPTNVFKIYTGFAGTTRPGFEGLIAEQEKELVEDGQTVQVAKYIHGVGDEKNPIRKLLGGVFGAGMLSRIVRGYTFISRNYQPGDHIVVTGFSRGAYTARALAGLIASQGLLAKPLTADKSEAYQWGAKAWYHHRKHTARGETGFLQKLAEALADLRDFFSQDDLKAGHLVPVDRIKAVGVWDTVGALGLPRYYRDRRADAFRFTNTRLSSKVEKGFHAVALDEQRLDFTPTLWDKTANVVQMVFPGAHADVGGGYATVGNESGLSDVSLGWMVENLKNLGARFAKPIYVPYRPDPRGTAHKPWMHPPFVKLETASRTLRGIPGHPSIAARRQAGLVIHEPGEHPAPYQPSNWPA
jgi:uncharacterized protein (DUF2235 family)